MTKDIKEIRVWVDLTQMSERLRNSLLFYSHLNKDHTMDDITKESFTEIKGVGEVQWEEFISIRPNSVKSNI